MSLIHQDILSHGKYPRSFVLYRVPADDPASHLTQLLVSRDKDIIPIGIAYHVSRTGRVDFICLANLTNVYIISLYPKKTPFSRILAALLCANGVAASDISDLGFTLSKTCLVGFGMPRTTIQINHGTRLPVKGVDLSTLFSPDSWPPSLIFTKGLGDEINKLMITQLWMGSEDSAERDIALQAWLAAWYVLFSM